MELRGPPNFLKPPLTGFLVAKGRARRFRFVLGGDLSSFTRYCCPNSRATDSPAKVHTFKVRKNLVSSKPINFQLRLIGKAVTKLIFLFPVMSSLLFYYYEKVAVPHYHLCYNRALFTITTLNFFLK